MAQSSKFGRIVSKLFVRKKQIFNSVTLFSLNCFLLTAVFLQFSLIGVKAMLMVFFKIPFTWHPLYLKNVSGNLELWGFDKLFLVYGGIPLLYFLLGLLLAYYLRQNHDIRWRGRLLLTWLSFFMVNALFAGMFASLISFDGLGVVLIWLFPGYLIRFFIAAMAAMIMLLSKPFWEQLFYKATYSKSILRSSKSKELFFKQIYTAPWLLSIPIFLIFSIISAKWYWTASIIAMGMVVHGVNWYLPPPTRIRIIKEETVNTSVKYPALLLISIILFLYLSNI